MAEKYYLDEEGLRRLVEFIKTQSIPNTKAIELLRKTDGTPGSIQKMIDDSIDDLGKTKPLVIYGGSASEVFEEV